MFTRMLTITNEWIKLSDIPDSVFIAFRGVIEICESSSVPDDKTPLLRLENEMAIITVDALSWVRVPSESRGNITVYIL